MLKVMIEIWPYGLESEKRLISEGLLIWNTGKGDANIGEYECMLGFHPDQLKDKNKKIYKVNEHMRNEGALKLLYLCLKEIYGK